MDTALRLERYFGWPADVWLNLQSHHDQQTAKASLKSTLAEIQPCPALVKLPITIDDHETKHRPDTAAQLLRRKMR